MRGSRTIALLAGLFICVSAAALRADSTPLPGPAVTLSVTLPDGTTKQLDTHESGLATVTVGGTDYGFRPTMHDDFGRVFTVTIFDMGDSTRAVRELGMVQLKGGAAAVASKTTPAFKVQARRSAGSPTT